MAWLALGFGLVCLSLFLGTAYHANLAQKRIEELIGKANQDKDVIEHQSKRIGNLIEQISIQEKTIQNYQSLISSSKASNSFDRWLTGKDR